MQSREQLSTSGTEEDVGRRTVEVASTEFTEGYYGEEGVDPSDESDGMLPVPIHKDSIAHSSRSRRQAQNREAPTALPRAVSPSPPYNRNTDDISISYASDVQQHRQGRAARTGVQDGLSYPEAGWVASQTGAHRERFELDCEAREYRDQRQIWRRQDETH